MNKVDIENNTAHSPAPAVDRACAILRLISRTREPMGVSAVARALGIGKSTVHGILQALLAAGALEDTGGRRFRLGPFVEHLARSRRGTLGLAEICRPHLAWLVERRGHTSMFGTPDGDRFRIVTVVEGKHPFSVKAVQGGSIPLLAGVMGKIALAWGAVRTPDSLPRFTEESVTDIGALQGELETVRRERLALDRGQYLTGVCAAASPILDVERLVGIIYCAGFQDQMKEDELLSLGRDVSRAAQAVSEEFREWRTEP